MLTLEGYTQLLKDANKDGALRTITRPHAAELLDAKILYEPYCRFEGAWETAINGLSKESIKTLFLAEFALNFYDYIYLNDKIRQKYIKKELAVTFLQDQNAAVLDFASFPVPYRRIRGTEIVRCYHAVLKACEKDHLNPHLTMLGPMLAKDCVVVPTYKRFAEYLPSVTHPVLQGRVVDDRILKIPKLGRRGLAQRIIKYFDPETPQVVKSG